MYLTAIVEHDNLGGLKEAYQQWSKARYQAQCASMTELHGAKQMSKFWFVTAVVFVFTIFHGLQKDATRGTVGTVSIAKHDKLFLKSATTTQ